MKQLAIGVLLGVGLVMVAGWSPTFSSPVFAQQGSAREGNPELIALSAQLADGKQQITVIDPRQRVVSVYHINPASGEIGLKSVRNIHWDLQMTQFNAQAPLPEEIRNVLTQR